MSDNNESNELLSGIQSSVKDMQEQMERTYARLEKQMITGTSQDGTVEIDITATYSFGGIRFDKEALNGGIDAFKTRIEEAWTIACTKVQETTQSQTVELLQSMDLPKELQEISDQSSDEDK